MHQHQKGKRLGRQAGKMTIKIPVAHGDQTIMAEISKDDLTWKTYTGPGAKNCLQMTTVDGKHFAIRNTRRGQNYTLATRDELQAFVDGIKKDFGIAAAKS